MKKLLLVVVLSLSSVAHALPEEFLNFHFSPAMLILGGIGGGLDYRFNEKVVAGFEASTLRFSLFGTEVKGSSFSVHGDYFFKQAFVSGPYLTAQAGSASAEVSYKDDDGKTYSASGSGPLVAIGGGYHWFWSSFNLKLGAAVGSNPVGTLEVKNDSGTVVKSQSSPYSGFIGEFQLGFTF